MNGTDEPTNALPVGATDAHAHVLRPDVASSVAGARYAPFDAGVERYLAHLDGLGLDRGVLVNPSTYGTDHTVLLDALRRHGERLRGVAVVPADVPAAFLDELHEAGVRGVRVQDLFPGGVDLAALPVLAERIAPYGWHVQVWTDPRRHLDRLPALVGDCPVPVVLDHLGCLPASLGPDDPAVALLLSVLERENAWIKLSGAYRLSPGRPEGEAAAAVAGRVRAVLDVAADRAVWGSDWPHVAPAGPVPTPAELRSGLSSWLPDAEVRRRVLVDNPRRLYDFPDAG